MDEMCWNKLNEVKEEIEKATNNSNVFTRHSLPIAKIKKIIKLDNNVKMISSEVPVLLSKACELFIAELAFKSYAYTLSENRKIIQRNDIAKAIANNDYLDFLIDIVEESGKIKVKDNSNQNNDLVSKTK